MMMLVMPPAVLKMWRKLLKTWARKLPRRVGRQGDPPLVREEVGRQALEGEDGRVEREAEAR